MNTKTHKFKKFFSYYGPYKLLFAADIFCAMVVAAMSLLFPQLIRFVTKDVLSASGVNMDTIFLFGGLMLLTITVKMFCTFFYDAKGHTMGAMMETDMRRELFDHYQKLSFSFYDRESPGKLMSRLTGDLNSLAELYHHGPEDMIIYLVECIGSLIILFTINTRLTFIILAFLPFVIIYAFFFNKKLLRAYRKNYEVISDVNNRAEENLSGIRTVQSFANEDIERERFEKENTRFFKSRRAIYHFESYFYTGMDTLVPLISAAIVVFGSMAILNETLDIADLLTFLLYAEFTVGPIPKMAHITQQYQNGFAAFNRFLEILHTEPEIADAPEAVQLSNIKGTVTFQDVSFKYTRTSEYVLNGLNLTVNPGESVALVGTSGVGKTTLCSLIPRFYDPESGQVSIDGIDVKNISLHSLRKNIGIVQQDTYLFSGSVADNIAYGSPQASKEEIIAAAKKANAHDFIMGLPNGYDTDIGHRGVRLSGGQKQRVSIARTFLKNPPILIFDEATSSLDNESEQVIQQSMEDLAKERTTIIIAHRLSTVRNARRILVIDEGRISESGTHQELIKADGIYARLYNMQFKD